MSLLTAIALGLAYHHPPAPPAPVAPSPPVDPATDAVTPPAPSTDVPAALEMPSLADPKPRDCPGLHNVVAFYEGFLSGSVPEGAEGFDSLQSMGIKTIISVDGAVPSIDMARSRGIRYIHLPIGYNGFDETRKLQLVRAARDAMRSGPVYIHCHHGKHRSAGAAAAVAASLGWLAPDQAVERMKASGTAPNYTGLYKCATESVILDATVIDAVSPDFPEVSQPATFVKSMIEIDVINDHLREIEKASWSVPKDHPDLVPVAEAGRMADLFRLLLDGEVVRANPPEFADAMRRSADKAQQLEDMLLAGEKSPQRLSEQLNLLQTSCKSCHARYRD